MQGIGGTPVAKLCTYFNIVEDGSFLPGSCYNEGITGFRNQIMPLYEYLCHRCQNKFEVIQKFSDEPLTTHESCGGELERLISTSALQFKGSGWYVNDYGRGGKLPSNGSSEKSGSKSEVKTEKKDAKPAAAPAADKK